MRGIYLTWVVVLRSSVLFARHVNFIEIICDLVPQSVGQVTLRKELIRVLHNFQSHFLHRRVVINLHLEEGGIIIRRHFVFINQTSLN